MEYAMRLCKGWRICANGENKGLGGTALGLIILEDWHLKALSLRHKLLKTRLAG